MAWTDADLQTVLQRGHVRVVGEASRPQQAGESPLAPHVLRGPVEHAVPLSNRPYQSKTEMRFATMLDTKQFTGAIQRWWYEPFGLRLATKTFYHPDFLVHYAPDASPWKLDLVCFEVKGFWRDDARVKIKVAAVRYPCFVFVAAQWKRGEWVYETLPIY